jgi:archaellum component FlaC
MVNIDYLIPSTRDLFRDAYNAVSGAVNTVRSWASSAYSSISSSTSSSIEWLRSQINELKEAMSAIPQQIWDAVWGA